MPSKLYEMHQHWYELPMVKCPHCGCEFQWDCYDAYPGRRIDCGECERTIWVAETYTAVHVRLSKEDECA